MGFLLVLISKAKHPAEACFYLREALEHGWSRAVPAHVTRFLLELGAGLSYLGRQYKLMNKPLGVCEYKLTQSLPQAYKSSLPSIEEIDAELGE